jgi:hypothetical protein
VSGFPDKLRLKEKAEEDLYFARHDRELLAARRDHRPSANGQAPFVISGGQTGVDRAALDAAMALGIDVGGWCPAGRRAEDGAIPQHYPLRETDSADYALRTEWNVRDSDGTLILYRGALIGGTALTAQLARRLGRPLLVRDLDVALDPADLVLWLRSNRVRELNCAGPRESGAPGVGRAARALLERVFAAWREATAETPGPDRR